MCRWEWWRVVVWLARIESLFRYERYWKRQGRRDLSTAAAQLGGKLIRNGPRAC